MKDEPRGPDEQLDLTLGRLLRLGVVVSGLVVLAGGVAYLAQHGGETADYRDFRGEPVRLEEPSGIVGQAWQGRGRGLIALGLLLLIATPVARVVFAAFAFLRERDRLYVAVSLFVLAVLLWGLFFGA
jgi:uncharacterized membrane protein